MLQFSKVLASLCAGCLCTLTIHQIPALGNVLLPQTHAIPETSPIRPVDVMPLEPLPTPAETAPAMSIPPTETQSPQTQTTAAVATAVTVLTATATTTIPPETTAATESETTVDGEYMILAPKIVMPHASMKDNVNKTGFSLVITKEPVEFGKSKNKAQIFITLAAVDKEQHTQALKEIMYLLDDDEIIYSILQSTTKEEIEYILKTNIKKYLDNQ